MLRAAAVLGGTAYLPSLEGAAVVFTKLSRLGVLTGSRSRRAASSVPAGVTETIAELSDRVDGNTIGVTCFASS